MNSQSPIYGPIKLYLSSPDFALNISDERSIKDCFQFHIQRKTINKKKTLHKHKKKPKLKDLKVKQSLQHEVITYT